jgi:hypothetical protein
MDQLHSIVIPLINIITNFVSPPNTTGEKYLSNYAIISMLCGQAPEEKKQGFYQYSQIASLRSQPSPRERRISKRQAN